MYASVQRSASDVYARSASQVRRFPSAPPGSCDIQMIFAILRRVGWGPYSLQSGGGTIAVSGPLTALALPYVDTLYLGETAQLTWTAPGWAGATAELTTTFDSTYADVEFVATYSWQSGTDSGHEAPPAWEAFNPAPPPLPATLYNNPGSPWPSDTYTFANQNNNYPGGTTPNPNPWGPPSGWLQPQTQATYTAAGYDDAPTRNPDGTYCTNHHIGFKAVLTLSNAFTTAQFGGVCDGFLGAATFQDGTLNPAKQYNVYQFQTGATQACYFRFYSEIPIAGQTLPTNYVTSLLVQQSRANGITFSSCGYPSQEFINDGIEAFSLFLEAPETPYATYLAGPTLKGPIAAVGIPCNVQGNQNPPSKIVNAQLNNNAGLPIFFGPDQSGGEYVFSCRSCVKNIRNMNDYAWAFVFNPGSNTWQTWQPYSGPALPASPATTIITAPAAGLSALYAVFDKPTFSVVQTNDPYTLGNALGGGQVNQNTQNVIMNVGQTITVYSLGFTARGNFTENMPAAWSIYGGGAGILTPSADGRSATFKATAVTGAFNLCYLRGTGTGMPIGQQYDLRIYIPS